MQIHQGKWKCTTWAACMSRFCLPLHSMKALMCTESGASHEAILKQLCMAINEDELRFRPGDKGFLAKVAKNEHIRFKLREKVTKTWQKAFYAVQLILAKENALKCSLSFTQDTKSILSKVQRLAKCVASVFSKKGDCTALKNAIELEGAVNGQVWHDRSSVVRQVEGIGPAYASRLCKAGIDSLERLRACQASRIEILLRRNPPFGNQVLRAVKALPELKLEVGYVQSENDVKVSIRYSSECNTQSVFHLLIIARSTAPRLIAHKTHYGAGAHSTEVSLDNWGQMQKATISWMCSSNGTKNLMH